MLWRQLEIRLRARPRGFHLVTGELMDGITAAFPAVRQLRVGLVQLFLQHTSASLGINENADPDVRGDMARWFDGAVPEGAAYFEHTAEGPDDMPAHLKSILVGCSATIPLRDGKLALGTWQGVYLGEHRDGAGSRTVLVTLCGE